MGATTTANPNITGIANPASPVFIELYDSDGTSRDLLRSAFARDMEERAMRRHAREDAYLGGQGVVPDSSIRDIGPI